MSKIILSKRKIAMPDGTKIYYRYYQNPKSNNLPIILNDGLGCDGFAWKYLIDYFKNDYPILHWNYRGHGKSAIPKNLSTISMQMISHDLKYLLNHLNIPKAFFCGHSMGVQVTLESFSLMPERFAGMALICGGYKQALKTWHASFERDGKKTLLNEAMKLLFPKFSKSFISHSKLWQPIWKQMVTNKLSLQAALFNEVNSKRIKIDDFKPYFDHLGKMEVKIFALMANSFIEHDIEKILPEIKLPTLVVVGGKDTFTPPWVSLDMHKKIRSSNLLYIPDGTHCSPIEHGELINLRLERLISKEFRPTRKIGTTNFSRLQVAS
ncbi:MAG: alpha/beta hydrolase [bacterium]|nr:alpha/beta hydrolase [bacterium]